MRRGGDERLGRWAFGLIAVVVLAAILVRVNRPGEEDVVRAEVRRIAPTAAEADIRLVNVQQSGGRRSKFRAAAPGLWCGSISGRPDSDFAIRYRDGRVEAVARSWVADRSGDQDGMLTTCAAALG
ncbi:hypothetical protein [Brevundimonas sp. Root1423]|uniref:hypothetical protein n=1 Tax=Brevundimonas sp. Root1423 TaxID=1736462 RepID=UPI0006FFC8C0|nr:hypothetical protein [Brevundimonas sp. Root1423]KQY80485.1 hypothetical protein ASD25_10195 [Brevundimonas sp. Root1423]